MIERDEEAADMLDKRGEFMTPEEVANILKVSIYTIRRWINSQTIPAYKIGRGWRIEAREFQYWLRANRQNED